MLGISVFCSENAVSPGCRLGKALQMVLGGVDDFLKASGIQAANGSVFG